MPVNLEQFNQTCLLAHWKSKRKVIWPMTLHQTCQLELWNLIRQYCCYVVDATHMPAGPVPLCVESCYVNAAATNMHAGQVQLPHTHRCCTNMPSGWMLLLDGFMLDHCHSISMLADLLPLNSECLLVWCFSICHTCWCVDSISAVPAGVVPQYRPCRQACCLIISHACWCVPSI